MASVNVTSAPASGWPSGSVTVTNKVTGSGSFERLIWRVEVVRTAVNLPGPRSTVRLMAATFPAGSVPVIEILFEPVAIDTLNVNVPSDSAVPATCEALASFRARRVVRAWVLPLIVTALPLTTALFFGEVMVIFGGTLSKT